MQSIKNRLSRLEDNTPPISNTLDNRVVIVGPHETEEEAYERQYCEPLTEETEARYRLWFILMVEAGPNGGPPDPNNHEARCQPS